MKVERNILLNPGPATTTDRAKASLVVPDICPREKEFGDLTTSVQQKTVDVVQGGSDYDCTLFGGSGTAAVEVCLSSVVGPGDKILVVNNGAYGKRALEIVEIYGIPFVELTISNQEAIKPNQIIEVLDREPGITHLFFVHHETTTGLLNPLGELINLCQQRGLISIIDAMSSYAGIPISAKETPFDYLVSSSNKCVQGFAGLGMVIFNKEKLELIKNYPPRNLYLNLYRNTQYQKKHGQFQFTPPVQILYALDTVLDEFFEETQAKRTERYYESYETLMKGMKDLKIQALLPVGIHSKLLTTFIDPDCEDYSFNAMHDYLFAKGITIYPGKISEENTFRIANIGAIDKDDIAKFILHMKEYLSQIGYLTS